MTYYNLPHELDLLIGRLKAKSQADNYTGLVNYFNSLKLTKWIYTIKQLEDIVVGISLYQTEAVDGDLQDIIDDLTDIKWYNALQSAKKIEKAVKLIETL